MKNCLYFSFLYIVIIFYSQAQNITSLVIIANFQNKADSLQIFSFDTNTIIPSENSTVDTAFYLNISDDSVKKRLASLEKEIPLHFNKRVKQFIDFFAYTERELTLRILQRKPVYFPIFESILKEKKLPEELKYLPVIESALVTKARSRAGAVGLWQFMPFTGKQFGLKQNGYIDERMNPEKSTRAACSYLKQLYNQFNDWELAIAAYNCGPSNVRKAMRRTGKKKFWNIYYRLPRETRGYLPQFIAILYLLSYAEEYRLIQENPDFPIPYEVVYIDESLDLKKLAEAISVSKEHLSKINPSLRYGIIPQGIKNYPLCIPSNKIVFFQKNREKLLQACKYSGKSLSDKKYGKGYYHTVRSGECLGIIAQRNRVRISSLRMWNNIYHDRIYPGQKLIIYHSRRKSIVKPSFKEENSNEVFSKKNLYNIYTVRSGDTLWYIAKSYPNMTVEKLKELNKLRTDKLHVGQKLRIQ